MKLVSSNSEVKTDPSYGKRDALRSRLVDYAQAKVLQRTEFTLADQVLSHMLVSLGIDVHLEAKTRSAKKRWSTARLTLERYDLKLSQPGLVTSADILASANLLFDWSHEDLVQYVLDHEVPVDPQDMAEGLEYAA